MARTVADVRLGLGVLAGRHPRDPYSVPAPPAPPHLPGVRCECAVARRPARWRHESARRGARDGGGRTRSPRPATTSSRTSRPASRTSSTRGPRSSCQDIRDDPADDRPADVRGRQRLPRRRSSTRCPPLDLDGYTGVVMARQSLMREWAQWFLDIDLLLTPTWTQLPFAHGWDVESPARSVETLEMMRPVTAGQPARAAVGVRAGRTRRRPSRRRAPHRRSLRRRHHPHCGCRRGSRSGAHHPHRPRDLTPPNLCCSMHTGCAPSSRERLGVSVGGRGRPS